MHCEARCFANMPPVLLQAMKEDPPLEAKCRDKFLVQSVAISADKEVSNIAQIVCYQYRTSYESVLTLLDSGPTLNRQPSHRSKKRRYVSASSLQMDRLPPSPPAVSRWAAHRTLANRRRTARPHLSWARQPLASLTQRPSAMVRAVLRPTATSRLLAAARSALEPSQQHLWKSSRRSCKQHKRKSSSSPSRRETRAACDSALWRRPAQPRAAARRKSLNRWYLAACRCPCRPYCAC